MVFVFTGERESLVTLLKFIYTGGDPVGALGPVLLMHLIECLFFVERWPVPWIVDLHGARRSNYTLTVIDDN